MKEVTFSQQGENSRFRKIVTFLKWLKIVLINSRLLQNPCESYLYLFRKYVCIIPLVSSYLAWFRFVSENRIRRIIAARHARSTPRHSMSRVFRWFTETISKQMLMALLVFLYSLCHQPPYTSDCQNLTGKARLVSVTFYPESRPVWTNSFTLCICSCHHHCTGSWATCDHWGPSVQMTLIKKPWLLLCSVVKYVRSG